MASICRNRVLYPAARPVLHDCEQLDHVLHSDSRQSPRHDTAHNSYDSGFGSPHNRSSTTFCNVRSKETTVSAKVAHRPGFPWTVGIGPLCVPCPSQSRFFPEFFHKNLAEPPHHNEKILVKLLIVTNSVQRHRRTDRQYDANSL